MPGIMGLERGQGVGRVCQASMPQNGGGGGRVKDTVLSCAWGGMEELGKKGKKIATLGEIFVPL